MDQRQLQQVLAVLNDFANIQSQSNAQIRSSIRAIEAMLHSERYRLASQHGIEVYRKSLEELRNYTNLISVVGYGGAFAIWSNAKEVLCPSWFSVAGLLILTSLLLFAATEVGAMIWMDCALSDTRRPGKKFEAAYNAAIERRRRWTVWPFRVQVLTGFAGAGILLISWVLGLALDWRIPAC